MTAKTQLKISRWDVATDAATSDAPFEAVINPSGYTITHTVNILPIGKTKGAERKALALEKLVLDGTGVVASATGAILSVEAQVAALRKVTETGTDAAVVYPVVQVVWGKLIYLGRVTSVETAYTLFAPDGTPLRAQLSLKVVEYDPEELQQAVNAATDAMIKQLQADAGTRLDDTAFKAYKDARAAQAVARYNDLDSIRGDFSGKKIALPPRADLDAASAS